MFRHDGTLETCRHKLKRNADGDDPSILSCRIKPMVLGVELLAMFVLGAVVGSFLNVCIYRLPLEKSLLWPGSRCGHCQQPIRWYDNIPLLSYWWLRGRCRTCGQTFSPRYFLIELLTAASFAGLCYLEVEKNVHHLDPAILA